MQKVILPQRFFSLADLLVLLLIGTVIYGLISTGNQWRADYHPVTEIDLSIRWLPYYTILSGIRGLVAYTLSLGFTIVIGYWAAKSKAAERVLIPALDILQSLPVLSFLPIVFITLTSLFPKSNIGLELGAILLIFSGQVWNMTFSFYSSLKGVPTDFKEAYTVIGLSNWQTLWKVEMPFAAVNLVWNSLLSLAGGWFFLSVCESFQVGDLNFQLPGLGSYMQVAVNQWNVKAMLLGIGAMVFLIIAIDFVIGRPILNWVQRFRLEDIPGVTPVEPLMGIVLRQSRIVRWARLLVRRQMFQHHLAHKTSLQQKLSEQEGELNESALPAVVVKSRRAIRRGQSALKHTSRHFWRRMIETRTLEFVIMGLIGLALGFGCFKLLKLLTQVGLSTWVILIRNTFWTLVRVAVSTFLSTLWAVPVGIWIATSSKRIRVFQPIIQVMASFPAPMLYPIALLFFFKIGVSFDWAAGFLMMLGTQWYVLFNVLAGALKVPQELKYALELMETSKWNIWWKLYIPSIFPSLVTGWVTAAGGAWNASIVSEIMDFRGVHYKTSGLGATISTATANADFPLLAASLSVMVVVVVGLNRSVWAKFYHLAQNRYRMDL
jgi:NitT/TauT family transport system permease protein